MDEVERDIENYQGRGWRYLPKPQAGADNASQGLDNSGYHAKTKFNNYFIIHIRFIPTSYKFNYFDKMLELLYFISKMFPLLLGSAHHNYRIPRIIGRFDVIITEYQKLFVDVTS